MMGEKIATRVAYGKALAEFGGRDDIYVFDSDLKTCTMSMYFADEYPERFFNVGIAEANMVNIGAGFATCANGASSAGSATSGQPTTSAATNCANP